MDGSGDLNASPLHQSSHRALVLPDKVDTLYDKAIFFGQHLNDSSPLPTPQGVMSDSEARRRDIGGEILAYVW